MNETSDSRVCPNKCEREHCPSMLPDKRFVDNTPTWQSELTLLMHTHTLNFKPTFAPSHHSRETCARRPRSFAGTSTSSPRSVGSSALTDAMAIWTTLRAPKSAPTFVRPQVFIFYYNLQEGWMFFCRLFEGCAPGEVAMKQDYYAREFSLDEEEDWIEEQQQQQQQSTGSVVVPSSVGGSEEDSAAKQHDADHHYAISSFFAASLRRRRRKREVVQCSTGLKDNCPSDYKCTYDPLTSKHVCCGTPSYGSWGFCWPPFSIVGWF